MGLFRSFGYVEYRFVDQRKTQKNPCFLIFRKSVSVVGSMFLVRNFDYMQYRFVD